MQNPNNQTKRHWNKDLPILAVPSRCSSIDCTAMILGLNSSSPCMYLMVSESLCQTKMSPEWSSPARKWPVNCIYNLHSSVMVQNLFYEDKCLTLIIKIYLDYFIIYRKFDGLFKEFLYFNFMRNFFTKFKHFPE